jgi:hypothetical protein
VVHCRWFLWRRNSSTLLYFTFFSTHYYYIAIVSNNYTPQKKNRSLSINIFFFTEPNLLSWQFIDR